MLQGFLFGWLALVYRVYAVGVAIHNFLKGVYLGVSTFGYAY